ncbi:hypothetical protein DQ04_12241000 [Trypanosoma grayi]|uniref:hypothetical protein n=1 Tax=Trypanosoma grayi TaxID=71804 RepID=UPI0004F4B3DD|nr:hypothetical protein DQ04_12241000 [Trypanosoma grayi]KEG06787.1 hypothetical protein DQ04_12241000 [Trypanosoma grayi]
MRGGESVGKTKGDLAGASSQTSSCLGGSSWTTVTPSKRFVSMAETLSSFPDGFRVNVPRQCEPNPELMETPVSAANRAAKQKASMLHGKRAQDMNKGRLLRVFTRCEAPSLCRTRHNDNEATRSCSSKHVAGLGYWTVTYVTREGEDVASSKVVPPKRKGPFCFDSVVGAIVENAALLNLTVLYITYLDRDFGAYALLTSSTVEHCADAFQVVVESPSVLAAGCLKTRCEIRLRLTGSAHLHAPKAATPSSPQELMDKVFRAPGMQFRGVADVGAAVGSDLPKLDVSQWNRILCEEVSGREALCSEERSWRLILEANEKTRLYCAPKGKKSQMKLPGLCPISQPTVLNVQERRRWRQKENAQKREHDVKEHEPQEQTKTQQLEQCDMPSPPLPRPSTPTPPLNAEGILPVITPLCIVLEGEKWGSLLNDDRRELYEAIMQDVSSCLGIPSGDVIMDRGEANSPTVEFTVRHDGTLSETQLQSEIAVHEFPNTSELYALFSCSSPDCKRL